MTQITDKSLTANVQALVDTIIDENPMHKSFIEGALNHVTDDELAMLDKYLDFCAQKGHDVTYMAGAYLTIVGDTFKEQIYFMKHKEYRHKTYEDVAGHVYDDKDYMDKYMYGLAITSFLWPNHLDMGRLFVETVPRDKTGKYLDIGPGHGYYLMKAMELGSFNDFLGIDISEASIKQTGAIIDQFKPDYKDRFRLEKKDFLEAKDLEPGSYDAVVIPPFAGIRCPVPRKCHCRQVRQCPQTRRQKGTGRDSAFG